MNALETLQRREMAENVARALRPLTGYVENGTDTTLVIAQDDATRDWVVKVGKETYWAPSLAQALVLALDAAPEQP